MRFATTNGQVIDVYQAATQMTDESGQSYPYTIDTLLDRALGPEGYYGAFVANMHTDADRLQPSSVWSSNIVNSAKARGVPVISARQMLTWLDARNGSSIGSIVQTGDTETFSINARADARGLQAMVPVPSGKVVSEVLRGVTPITNSVRWVKGVLYAMFPASTGNYTITYAADTTPPTVTSVSPTNGAVGVSVSTAVVVMFSKPMDPMSIKTNSISVRGPGGALVPATVVYNPSALEVTAVLTPHSPLNPATTYTVVVTNGVTGVRDVGGVELADVFSASFSTVDQAEFSLWGEFTGTADGGDPSSVEVGMKFQSVLSGYITGIRFYKSAANTGTHVGNLWGTNGTPLARVTFVNEAGSGWQYQALTNPVAIAANTTYVVSYYAPVGRYAYTAGAFTSGVTNYPLRALSSGEGGGNGVFKYNAASIFPTDSGNGASYWVDVVFTMGFGPDTNGPTVIGVNPVNGAAGVSPATRVGVTFSEAMDPLTITNGITLTNSAGVLVPSGVAYYAATNTAVLTPISLLALSSTYTVVVASGGAGVKDVAGNALTNVFTASFTTALPDTGGPTVIGVDPTNGAVGVNPATPVRVTFSEAMDPLTITNGITLTNSAGELVPSVVTYYATTNTAVLTPNSPLALSNTYTVVVASGAAGVKDVAGNELTSVFSASFTTTDEVSYSIWAASTIPTTPSFFDPGDPNPYELGVKFRSATNGYVRGIRFYKGAGNDGLHVGNLWRNSDQALLASVPFGNETASGWQYQALTNPVAITANTTYVVSYHITNGRYAVDTAVQPGNLTVGVNNPPLRALAHNEQGPNGVYAQTGGIAFPTAGNGANYWVDVVFTAGFGPDTNGPTVVGVSPVNGAAGVSPATRVRVTFGEAMDPLTITNGITLTNSAGVLVPSAVAYYAATNTAVLTPNSLLEPGANYTVVVANGGAGVKDLAGNALTNIFTASFTTALPDTEGPMVSWVDPPNGAVGVSPATLVRVTFSEAMDPLTITNGIILSNWSGGLVASTVAYYGTTNTAVLTPLSPLGLSSTYRVVVANGGAGVKDVAGNALTNVFTASFTTTDQTEFSLWDEFTGTADGGDSNGVEVGLKFQSALSGYITGIRFYKSAGNTGTHVGNLWELDGTPLARVTFVNEAGSGWQYQALTNPVAILANTTYVVSYYAPAGHYSFTAGAFTSGVTNYPLRALSSSEGGGNGVFVQSASSAFPNQTFNSANYWVDVVFRTGFGPDTNGPTVVGVSPVNGAVGVSPATLVRVTFSEAMDPVSITNGITLTNSAGTLVPSTVAYYAATNTAVLTPVSALALSTRYTVVVANGGTGVKDVAGNGLTNVFTASFTTVLADTNGPTVVGVSPVNGAAGVSPATLVRVTFSEAMDPVSITNGITLTNSAGALVPSTVAYYAATNTAVLTPVSPLALSTRYTVVVANGGAGVKDVAGNGMTNVFTASFTTVLADTNGPTVVGVSPVNGAAGVSPATQVQVTFSEAMDPVTITNGITLTNSAGALVPSAVAYYAATNTAVLTPVSALALSTRYTVVVANGGTGVKDVAGNGMTNVFTASFTTVLADTNGPTVVGVSPVNGAAGVSPATPVQVTFSEAMDPVSITNGITLTNSAGVLVPSTVAYYAATNTAVLTPVSPLALSTRYTVVVANGGAGVKDLAGNALTNVFTASFTTTNPVSYTLTVSGITADSKVYDTTTKAVLQTASAVLVGRQGSDDVILITAGATGVFDSKNVGTNRTVTVSGLTISGADASKYTLAQPAITADITPAGLLVTAITASNKVYDATTVATLNTGSAALVRVPPLPDRPGDIGFRYLSRTNDTTGRLNYVTAQSYRVGSNCLALAAIVNSGTTLTPTNFSGNGLSWQRILTTNFNTLASPSRCLTVYAAMSNNISALGRCTAQFKTNQTGCSIYICELTNVWFADGVMGAIVQANAKAANSSANPSNVLSALQAHGQNAVVAFFGGASNPLNATPESGWTEDVDMGYSSPSTGLGAYHRLQTTDNLVVLTRSASAWASAMMELRSLNDGPPQGLLGGDEVTLVTAGATGMFTNKDVGLGKVVQIAGLAISGADAFNYSLTQPTTTADITPAPLAVTATDTNKVYGSLHNFVGIEFSLNGTLFNGDALTNLTLQSGGAGVNATVGSYPIVPSAAQGIGLSNYVVFYTNGTLSVTAAGMTVVANNASRVYGATNPVFSGTITGIRNGDNIAATYASTATVTSTVGTYPITPTLVDPGGKLSNYTVSSTNGTLSVTTAGLTVAANNASRVYGATNPVFNGTIIGIRNGDNITATYASTATVTSTVGMYPITPTLVDPGGKLSNYAVSSTNGTLSVTTAGLTVAANNASRVYGATNPVFSGTITGIRNGDNITATYASTATVTSTVGPYPITPTLVDPGGKLSNYAVSSTNGTLSVTTAGLTVAANNASRVYGATNPVFSGTITGIRNGDNITATYASTATVTSTVGLYPITPTLVDPGGKLSNYAVSSTNGTLSVTTAGLTVAANNASRVYGATNPVFSGTITGIRNGDNITATYDSTATVTSTVGMYPITPTLVDPGSKLSNYAVSSTNGTLNVSVASLAVVANNASRVYGATNPAFSGTITGIQNNDNITATYATTATLSSSVGPYPITPTLMDPGSKLSNYSVSATNGTLSVTAALLTGVADAKSRLYGAANPPFTVTYSGFVNGQNVSVVTGTPSGSTPATTNSPVGAYPVRVGGQSAPNYTIQYVDGTLTVLPTPLLVTGDNTNRAYGQPNPGFTATITGWVNGEDTRVLGGALQLSSPAQTNSPVGSYPIIPEGLTATNYALTFSNGTLTVAAYALSVTADNESRVYGASNPALTGSVVGLQNGDNISAAYATVAGSNSGVGSYPITISLLDPDHKLGNYSVNTNNGTLTINPALLTVTADPQNKRYGQADPALTYQITSGGLVNGDSLSGALSREAGENPGTYVILQGTLANPNYALTYVGSYLTITRTWLLAQADDQIRVYGETNPVLTVSYSGFVGTDGVANLTELPHASTAAQATSAVGDYDIILTGGTATNYVLIPLDGKLRVTAAPLAVAANSASRVYGATNPVFSGTITGIRNGDNITAAYTSTATVTSTVGAYPIVPTLVDPGSKVSNYTVSSTNGTLSVTTAGLTVAANNASRVYGATNPVFSGTITGIRNGDNITATYASTATVTSSVGSYPIAPTLVDPGSKLSNYAVSGTNGTLSVTTAGLTVAANNASRVYGATNPVFSGTITGIRNGDNITATYASTATVTSTVGMYPIASTLVDPGGKLSNYTVSSTNGTLSVTAAGLTVVANNASRIYGATNPVFSGTITGIQSGDDITATYASTATVTSTVGMYPITPTLVDPGGKLSNYTVSSTNGTLSVTAAGLTVVANNASRVYGATNPVFNGTIIGIRNGDNITATYASTATVTSTVGPYPITPTLVDPGSKLSNYAVSSTDGTLSVTTAGLTVAANNASRVYGATNPVFSGTITGIRNGDNITATYASTATATSTVGMYPITPTLVDPGGKLSNYAVSSTNGTLSVTTAGLTVAANNASRVYGATNPVFSGTITGIRNGDNITATYASTATPTSPIGSYPIAPILVDPGSKLSNYAVSSTNGTLTVNAAPLTVMATGKFKYYGQADPALTFRLTSGALVNGDSLTGALSRIAGENVGAYAILQGTLAATTNYVLTYVEADLTVLPAWLVVQADDENRVYGATNPVFTLSYTGFVGTDGATNLTELPRASTIAQPNSPIGDYEITLTGGSASNYALIYLGGTLTVTAAQLTAAVNNASRIYGATNPTFSGTITGIQNGDNITATYATTATESSPVGSYPITPTLADPSSKLSNYTVNSTDGTLNVTAAGLMVVANNASRPYGAPNPAFTGTITGVQSGDNITATYATVATQTSPVGTYSIVASLLDPAHKLSNYVVTLHNGALTITTTTVPVILSILPTDKTNVVITWTSISNSVYRVQYKGNLASTNWINLAPDVIATGSTASFTDHPAGASQRYYRILFLSSEPPIAPIIQSIVGAGTPNVVITWSAMSNRVYRVQYKANLASTSWFNLAPDVTATGTTAYFTDHPGAAPQRFYRVVLLSTVTPLTPLVVAANNASRVYGATNPVFSGTITGLQSGDMITATYTTTATSSSPVGTYAITPDLADPNGKLDNYIVSTTNGTLTVTPAPLTVTANNASRPYGAANPAFSGSITGIQNGDNIPATYSTTATVSSPAGMYPIVPNLIDPGNKLPNYNVTLNNGTLTVTALIRPIILSIVRSANTNVVITWTSASNSVYRVQCSTNLASANWINLTPDVIATGSTASFTDHPASAPQRYYRVLLVSTTPLTQSVIRSLVGAGTTNVAIRLESQGTWLKLPPPAL